MVPPERRLPQARRLVEQRGYFTVRAPRQTGKTTTLRALARMLLTEGGYAALHVSCDAAASVGDDYEAAQRAILAELWRQASIELPPELRPPEPWPVESPRGAMTSATLTAWARACRRPIVLILDAIDALRGASQEAVLRQLMVGYPSRPESFPASVVVAGVHDAARGPAGDPAASPRPTSSPFGVKLESTLIDDFTEAEVFQLYGQHTADTGQPFDSGAMLRVWELTRGQPWLVNALAREVVEAMGVQPPTPIAEHHVDEAKERLLRSRTTHLDHLVAHLAEPEVRRVLAPVLGGAVAAPAPTYDDDVRHAAELGLVARSRPLTVANPIYTEAITRAMGRFVEDSVPVESARELCDADGKLEVDRALAAFVKVWTDHGQALATRMPYPEVGPQLVLMAFLQRLVNEGGAMDRQLGAGRGRIDLLLRWPHNGALGERVWQLEPFVLMSWSEERPDPLPEGLRLLEATLDQRGLAHGTLVIFDRRPARDTQPSTPRTRIKKLKGSSGRVIAVLRI
jgi:hypothetical protein